MRRKCFGLLGYGVIGNTGDSGSSVLGSSPGTPALFFMQRDDFVFRNIFGTNFVSLRNMVLCLTVWLSSFEGIFFFFFLCVCAICCVCCVCGIFCVCKHFALRFARILRVSPYFCALLRRFFALSSLGVFFNVY